MHSVFQAGLYQADCLARFTGTRHRRRYCSGKVGLDRIVAVAFGKLSGNGQTFYSFIISVKHEKISSHRATGQYFRIQILSTNCDLQCTIREFKTLLVLTGCVHEPTHKCQHRGFWNGWRPESRSFELPREHFSQFLQRRNRTVDVAHAM